MTHTFKLARRMARFRLITATSAVLVAGACAGVDDPTFTGPSAPEALPDSATNDSLPSTDQSPPLSPSPSPAPVGIPFGPFALWSSDSATKRGPAPFTGSQNSTDPAGIITMISSARAMKHKLQLAMTGGSHCLFTTPGCDSRNAVLPGGKFDRAKWNSRMNLYNTPAIQAAVAAGVADGTIIGNSIMDEPEAHGLGDGNTWGPEGTMTKPELDDMARYVKAIFPTLPVGVNHGSTGYAWRPTERYQVVDYVLNQYAWWNHSGDAATWRDKVLAQAWASGVTVGFSLNIRGGGIQDWRTKRCPIPLTGGPGPYVPTCQMTPQQIREWGRALGPYGCMLLLWEYNATMMGKRENQKAFSDVAAHLATAPAKSCRRT